MDETTRSAIRRRDLPQVPGNRTRPKVAREYVHSTSRGRRHRTGAFTYAAPFSSTSASRIRGGIVIVVVTKEKRGGGGGNNNIISQSMPPPPPK